MYGDNPRKQLRKNIEHLRTQKSLLEDRLRSFERKIEKLTDVERNGDIGEVRCEIDSFNDYSWLAFD